MHGVFEYPHSITRGSGVSHLAILPEDWRSLFSALCFTFNFHLHYGTDMVPWQWKPLGHDDSLALAKHAPNLFLDSDSLPGSRL